MSHKLRTIILAGSAAALLLLPMVAFVFDQVVTSGEVARNVSAAGVELGGLGQTDALVAIAQYEDELRRTPAHFMVNNVEFTLDPDTVDLHIDEAAVVKEAMQQRHDRGFPASFFSWFGSFGDHIEINVPVTLDPDLLGEVLSQWEQQAIDEPAYEGGVVVDAGRVLPDYPRAGEGIDRDPAEAIVLATLSSLDRSVPTLPTKVLEPDLTRADVDAAVGQAGRLLDGPVTLVAGDPEVSITFSTEQLTDMFVSRVTSASPPELIVGFDGNALASLLEPHRQEIEQPARDAAFFVDEETEQVTLQPSRDATLLNVDMVAAALRQAALSPTNAGPFPFESGTEPAFTTADAEAMGPITKVSGFTTEYPAGQARVTNIHLMADAVDGAIVLPGEEFSLNQYVGERTRDKGYVMAPMILGGELVDSVGGGVSQFATTFYNAVFFGCYEDVAHQPHSYYFTRYPEGREATISWPEPDLVFRNDSDALIIIKTQYTATSITVEFYGNNGGRVCEAEKSGRYGYTDPEEVYEEDPELTPEDEIVDEGSKGWAVDITRIMTFADGSQQRQTWTHRYHAYPTIIKVHPCNMPDAEIECPILVPGVIGQDFASAQSALSGAGFNVVQGPTVTVENEAQNGTVVSQSPEGGAYLDAGETVTVNLGVYVAPDPGPDPVP
jgi:vancomycin resistance protein YoaR